MAVGWRHFGRIRTEAHRLAGAGRDRCRADRRLCRRTFSGGMQQRLQIARNLVTQAAPRPDGRADRRARCVGAGEAPRPDTPAGELISDLAVIIVTHDLAVARLLSDRMLVMRRGEVVEHGLTDRVLDDPQDPYSQLLVSSILAA